MQITEDLRVSRADDRNLALEQYTEGVNPKTKEPTASWKVIGYYGNVKHVLTAILDRELLVDVKAYDTIEIYLEAVLSAQDEFIKRCERVLVKPIEAEFKGENKKHY